MAMHRGRCRRTTGILGPSVVLAGLLAIAGPAWSQPPRTPGLVESETIGRGGLPQTLRPAFGVPADRRSEPAARPTFARPAGAAQASVGDPAPRKESRYGRLLRSTAWVVAEDGQGTAWVVDREKKLLVSNYHVVYHGEKNRLLDKVVVIFPAYEEGRVIAEREFYQKNLGRLEQQGRAVVARVVDAIESVDLALLAVDALPEDVAAVPLARSSAEPGSQLHSIGNPGSSSSLFLYTQGFVKQVARKAWRSHMGQDNFLRHEARVVETQSPTNPGDSGGPVVNDDGELVGVTQGGSPRADLLNWAIDVSEVRSYVAKSGWMAQAKTAEERFARGRHYYDDAWYETAAPPRRRKELALADLDAAIAMRPDYAEARLLRARLYRSQGLTKSLVGGFAFLGKTPVPRPVPNEYLQAVADCDAVLRLRPNDATALALRGEVRLAIGGIESQNARVPFAGLGAGTTQLGLDELRLALTLDRNCFDAHRALASHWSYGDPAKAVAEFDEMVRIRPTLPGPYVSRAKQKELAEDLVGARADYTKAIELDPTNVVHRRYRAAFDEKQGRHDVALADRTAAVELVPESPYDWKWRADCLLALKRPKDALEDLTRGIATITQLHLKTGNLPELLETRGDVRQSVGDLAGAVQDWATALDGLPDYDKDRANRLRAKIVALRPQ